MGLIVEAIAMTANQCGELRISTGNKYNDTGAGVLLRLRSVVLVSRKPNNTEEKRNLSKTHITSTYC